ncbi:IPT/TIG domain-containing protein, partial [Pontibacter vulgaris]|uniref:IPT/TIG domain-containing protein n=1 Tax=Pontibacter vulgaris TaxID=2905679 RepID=UPI001FA7A23C
MTITGSNFTNTHTVLVGSGAATDFTVVSDTEIKVVVPAFASTGKIQVQSNQGSVFSSDTYTVTGAPVITSFTPSSGAVGTVLKITGSNFTGANAVHVGSGAATDFTVVSDTEIKVVVPAFASTGKIQVQSNQGSVFSSDTYTVTGAPVITSFTPSSGAVGTVLKITGSNFTGTTQVYVGNGIVEAKDFIFLSNTEIQLLVPTQASSGVLRVQSNKGSVSSSGTYTVTGAPTITSFTPASGPVGTVVTVTGSNFTGATQVYVGNGMATAFTVVSDTELKVTVPALASTGRIVVRTSNGQVTSSGTYSVTGAPVITSFTPASGPVGTVVTVTGRHFTGATQVYVGNGMATAFTVVSDTELKVTVPALASTGAIRVITNKGQVIGSGRYTVTGAPTITSFTPASGPVGTVVTVTGSNFTGATQVYVGNGMATA